MTKLTGRCMCGAVSFSATSDTDNFSICHCQMCRRWAGSAFKAISVPTDSLKTTGAAAIKTRTSSAWGERSNCRECGSVLWYRLTDGPYVGGTNIALGLLDDTNGLHLKTEYFVDYKTSADELPQDREQMTEAEVMALFAPSEQGT